jgi:hypothetical protein
MTAWIPDGLTELESGVLTLMLDAPGNTRMAACLQLAHASAGPREMTGVGFYRNFVYPNDTSFQRNLPDESYTDVVAEHPELECGAMFVLFVRDGVVKLLEGVTFDGDWPATEDAFTLFLDPKIA